MLTAPVTPLYPLVCVITTPYGTVDFHEHMPPPTALQARPLRDQTRQKNIRGGAILTLAPEAEGWELTLAITERTGTPLALAAPLQACRVGDMVEIRENWTNRTQERAWSGVVIQPDSGAWIAGNPMDGDWFTIQMQFFSVGPQ